MYIHTFVLVHVIAQENCIYTCTCMYMYVHVHNVKYSNLHAHVFMNMYNNIIPYTPCTCIHILYMYTVHTLHVASHTSTREILYM